MGKKCIYCRNDMGVYTTKCPHCNSDQPPERKKPSIILGFGGVFFTFCFALLGFAYCTPHDNKPATDPETSQIEEHIPPAPTENMFEPIFSCEVAPGKKKNDTISVFLEDNNLTFSDVSEAETKFHIFDWDDWGYSKDTDYISFGF